MPGRYRLVWRGENNKLEIRNKRDSPLQLISFLLRVVRRYGKAEIQYQKWLGEYTPLISLNLEDREMAYYEIDIIVNKQTREKQTKRFKSEDQAFKFFYSINGGTPARAYVCSWNYRRLIGRIIPNRNPQSAKDKRKYLHQWGDQTLEGIKDINGENRAR